MKLKIADWLKKYRRYVVIIALTLIILTPILISVLAPHVSSEVSADGLLGYIIQSVSAAGTILLAYVAIRQNKKFKEENDKAQERLEKIALSANELSVIGKVIEYETANITRLAEKVDRYYTACSVDGLIEYLKLNNITQDENGFCLAKERKESELKQLFSNLFDEVKLDFHNFDRIDKTSDAIFDMQEKTMNLLEKMYEVYSHQSAESSESDVSAFIESRRVFRNEMDLLITRKRLYLDSIIYGQISYDKIKKAHYGKQKESQRDGQNEI